MGEAALRQDFVEHMGPYGGPPSEKSVRKWCEQRRTKLGRHGSFGALRRGDPAPSWMFALVAGYLLDPAHRGYQERRGLETYAAKRGFKGLDTATEADVIGLITTDEFQGDHGFADPGILYWIFSKIKRPTQHVRPFGPSEEQQVKECLAWICVEEGRQLSSPDLEIFAALEVAAARMGISLADYQARMLAIWRQNPWTIVRSVRGDRVTGVSVALPVTEAYYRDLRAGQGMSYQCQPSHVLPASQWLVVDAIAPAPHGTPREREPGNSLMMAVLCQHARLTDTGACPGQDPLRLLTFAETPVGEARAKRYGYRPTGTTMGGKDIAFLERTLHLEGAGLIDAMLIGIWQGLQREMSRTFPRATGEPLTRG